MALIQRRNVNLYIDAAKWFTVKSSKVGNTFQVPSLLFKNFTNVLKGNIC